MEELLGYGVLEPARIIYVYPDGPTDRRMSLEGPQPREDDELVFPREIHRQVLIASSVNSSEDRAGNARTLHVGGHLNGDASIGVRGPKLGQL